MAMSVTMQKVFDLALFYDEKLTADDKRFQHAVQILHEDGTSYFFHYAFLMNYFVKESEYIIVFTEHQGVHIFAEDDLHSYAEFSRINSKLKRLPDAKNSSQKQRRN